jgi:hypothetical protein
MSIADVLKQKNELLLELERSKLAKAKRAVVAQLASKAAALEADLVEAYLSEGKTQKAVINLISQASCYLDARRETEARRIFERALTLSQVPETQKWVQASLASLASVQHC